jgi:hypothetical protein
LDIIEEFWIITFEGIPIFNYSSNQTLNSGLISGFISAIQKFSCEITEGNDQFINSFTLGDSKYHFLINQKYQIFFVLKSSKELNPKFIQKHLKAIKKMFIKEFSEEIKSFNGEISLFHKFKPKIESYFQNKFLNFMDYLINL